MAVSFAVIGFVAAFLTAFSVLVFSYVAGTEFALVRIGF